MKRLRLNTTIALSMVIATGPAFAGNLSAPVIVAAPALVMASVGMRPQFIAAVCSGCEEHMAK